MIALNKWEFPTQICSTSLYQRSDGEASILLSHPGGNVTEIAEIPKEDPNSQQQSALESAEEAAIAASTKAFFERSLSGQKSSAAMSFTTPASAASAGSSSRQRNL